MAHTLQERYSQLVEAKLRSEAIFANLFNRKYEGQPTAGAVKIPVRTEVAVGAYNKATGKALTQGSTTYLTLPIDADQAVNELIDGYDAEAVPDNVVADRLDSAAYGLAQDEDAAKRTALTTAGNYTQTGNTTALTKSTAYEAIIDAIQAAKKAHVKTSEMWLVVSSDVYGLLLKDEAHFVKASNLGDNIVQNGLVGRIAGIPVYEDPDLTENFEFVLGNTAFCHFVAEFAVPVHVQDLAGSGTFIGASAVQGRRIYGLKISKPETIFAKKKGN